VFDVPSALAETKSVRATGLPSRIQARLIGLLHHLGASEQDLIATSIAMNPQPVRDHSGSVTKNVLYAPRHVLLTVIARDGADFRRPKPFL
jgi:hypothetical protein